MIGYDGQPGITKLTDGLVQHVDLTKVLAGPLVDWTLSIEVRVLCDVGQLTVLYRPFRSESTSLTSMSERLQ